MSWTAPTDNRGSAVTDYDLRYYQGSADPTDPADWIEEGETGGHTHTGTGRTATVTGLVQNTAYRVQVRGRKRQRRGGVVGLGQRHDGLVAGRDQRQPGGQSRKGRFRYCGPPRQRRLCPGVHDRQPCPTATSSTRSC